ncbi:hypothetical protein [Paenibacillus assamensis]|uniref:hypothetical protein n=1 Tax=Paenibacillus assamensis TaxID=311244 RepID=UPI00040F2EA5|nr:hypothetical protein [Paenibacillus assamensis]
MMELTTYFKKHSSWITKQYEHIPTYHDAFFLEHASDLFVHINNVTENEMFKYKIDQYTSTAIILKYNGEYLLHFDNYDSFQWEEIMKALGGVLQQGTGEGLMHDRRMSVKMKALGDNQLHLQFDYGEDHLVSSAILPKKEFIYLLIKEAQKYYSLLMHFGTRFPYDFDHVKRNSGVDLHKTYGK